MDSKIYIASDHGGFNLKKVLKKHLKEKGYEVEDMGNTKYDPGDDYPDFIIPLALRVSQSKEDFGIVIGRWGSGEAIAANKVEGIRAALSSNQEMAKKAREHNNANILSLGADYLEPETAIKIVDVFLETSFSEKERHKRRLEKISSYKAQCQ